MPELDIIFEDGDIIVVNKPPGLSTQAPIKFDSLEARIRTYLWEQAEDERTPYLGIPHRLDRCASGVIVFAKRKKAAQRLAKQFQRREVEKGYFAILSGVVEPNKGEWQDYLRKIPEEPRGEVIPIRDVDQFPDAKLAILQYEVTENVGNRTRMNVRLETGRMHQIRIQCAARGFPILGDKMYGSEFAFGQDPEHERDRQIALHAADLQVEHPRSREQMTFEAPLPAIWPT